MKEVVLPFIRTVHGGPDHEKMVRWAGAICPAHAVYAPLRQEMLDTVAMAHRDIEAVKAVEAAEVPILKWPLRSIMVLDVRRRILLGEQSLQEADWALENASLSRVDRQMEAWLSHGMV